MHAKKLIFTLTIIILSFVLLEVGCYIILKLSEPGAKNTRDWLNHFKASGLYEGIDINAFYNEQRIIGSNMSFDFYRYYRPMANFKGRYFTTDKDGFRGTELHFKNKNLKRKVIVFLGGSTMWGTGAAGNNATIPSQFSKCINEMDPDINYEVKNYSIGGYHNAQEMIVLLEKLGTETIDFVIFYDWVNEAIMGYREFLDGNTDRPFLQPSVNVGYDSLIKFLAKRGQYDEIINFGIGLKKFVEKSNIAKVLLKIRNKMESKANKKTIGKNFSELDERELKQAERIVSLYRKNKKIIEALSKAFNFTPYFVMQPNLFTKGKLSEYEQNSIYFNDVKSVVFQRKVYELARKEFSSDRNFYDISGCFDTDATFYLDDHHTSIKGNELIAKALLDKIGTEIIRISRE